MENELLHKQRHSLAHIMVQAQQRLLDPDLILGVGPAIDNGYYHDFLWSEKADQELIKSEESVFKTTLKEMQRIIKENQDFIYIELPGAETKELLTLLGQPYTLELCEDLIAQGETKLGVYINTINGQAAEKLLAHTQPAYLEKYKKVTERLSQHTNTIEGKFVTFVNMCKGPHVENTKEIPVDVFVLDKLAGAYWKGNENNTMMTRIYALSFETKDELKAYQAMMEEAKKRDHRLLGQKLKLFTISPLIGAGLPMLQPNGMIIRKEIEDYLRELHKNKGYQRVWTPHLCKHDLYIRSGHINKYGDNLFKVKGRDEEFFIKPMNCPHHMQIFADNQFSYRDMPIRYFEPATVYRDEKTGELGGLLRVRAITQDDGHLFCRATQIEDEVSSIVSIIKTFFSTMGMIDNYRVSLSVRGEDKSKYLGSDEVWEKAEGGLEKAAIANNLPFKKIVGEAAFYGPKLDFMFKDCLGRERQLSTIQCDFNLPERFDLSFINEKGEKERPVVIHRAISGSLERFMGVMIEHFAGAFPLWLAPKQIQIVPVADAFNDYAAKIATQLRDNNLRVTIDDSADSFSKKIRNAELMKIPYMIIVGEKEQSDNSVSVRVYKTKEQLTMSVADFIQARVKEYKERAL